jgi:3-deoxy-manno-octulosonate cytidylyltransferase (CMP-KDO synthetase)
VEIAGRSLILRVCDQAAKVPGADRFLVATDDARILNHVIEGGYEALMTSPEHASGSDRVAEAAGEHVGLILNLQGDEPLADPEIMGRLITRLESDSSLDMGTVAVPLAPGEEGQPDRVKVLVDSGNLAVDFHRQLPGTPEVGLRVLRHAGVYLYPAKTLRSFTQTESCERERAEGLEQLRALEMGLRITVVEGNDWAPGVDRPDDLKVIESLLASD